MKRKNRYNSKKQNRFFNRRNNFLIDENTTERHEREEII